MAFTCNSCGLLLKAAQTFQRGDLMVCLDCSHKRGYADKDTASSAHADNQRQAHGPRPLTGDDLEMMDNRAQNYADAQYTTNPAVVDYQRLARDYARDVPRLIAEVNRLNYQTAALRDIAYRLPALYAQFAAIFADELQGTAERDPAADTGLWPWNRHCTACGAPETRSRPQQDGRMRCGKCGAIWDITDRTSWGMLYPAQEAAQETDQETAAHDLVQVALVAPLELQRTSSVGFYYRDASGRSWSTWSGPAVACAICGASIQGGYRTPGGPGTPEQSVCVSHVHAHNAPPCPTCAGSGRVRWVNGYGAFVGQAEACPRCKGRGAVLEEAPEDQPQDQPERGKESSV